MNNQLNEFFNKDYTYAIVGASNNEEKYGFKIFKTLIDAKYNAIPINPKEKTIFNVKCYTSILEVPRKIDVVDFVVPPSITLEILKQVKEKKITKVWFQPNTYDEKCINFCKKNNIKYLMDFCLLKSVLENN